MNKLLITIVGVLLLLSCNSARDGKKDLAGAKKKEQIEIVTDKPILTIQKNKKSFGKVKKEKQEYAEVEYEFENTGDNPLVIIKIDVSCDCLSTEYPKQPIKKGEKGIIKVKVQLKSQSGDFNKTAFIKSNAQNDVVLLRIVGKIK